MKNLNKRILTSLLLFLLIYFSLKNLLILFVTILLINFIVLSELKMILKKIFKKNHLNQSLFFFFFTIYMVFFSTLIWTYLLPEQIFSTISLTLILVICISTDIGGYAFGKIIGGKTFTKISPKKTYSGIAGSFIFSYIAATIFKIFFGNYLEIKMNFLILILVISTVSQLGDLTISFLKRKANIKDTGSILPGHGGILDRIDGILFALPLGIILISI